MNENCFEKTSLFEIFLTRHEKMSIDRLDERHISLIFLLADELLMLMEVDSSQHLFILIEISNFPYFRTLDLFSLTFPSLIFSVLLWYWYKSKFPHLFSISLLCLKTFITLSMLRVIFLKLQSGPPSVSKIQPDIQSP